MCNLLSSNAALTHVPWLPPRHVSQEMGALMRYTPGPDGGARRYEHWVPAAEYLEREGYAELTKRKMLVGWGWLRAVVGMAGWVGRWPVQAHDVNDMR